MSGNTDAVTLRLGFHNRDVLSVSRGFRPSNYSTLKTLSVTVESEAIPAYALLAKFVNVSQTAAEYVKYAFGLNAADAENNLLTGSDIILAGVSEVIGIPDNAGGIAFVANSGTPSLSVSYGA